MMIRVISRAARAVPGLAAVLALMVTGLMTTVLAGCALSGLSGPANADQLAADVAANNKDMMAPVAAAAPTDGAGFGAFLAARQARSAGDIASAAFFYNMALEADPDNPWLLRRAFLLTVSEGDVETALPMAEKVLADDPQAPVANLAVAADDLKNGRYGKAEARISLANKRRGSMRLVGPLLRTWAAYGDGGGVDAADRLSTLERTEAFSLFSFYHKALVLGLAGDLDGAITAFDSYAGEGRLDLRTHLLRASLVARRDGVEVARTELRKLGPRFGEDQVLKGYLDGTYDITDAFPVRSAVDGAAEALYGAASVLARDEINDVALIYLRLALHLRPDMDVARALLGDIWEAGERWREALAAYEAVDRKSPYKWAARLRIAWMLDKLDRTDQAIELLRRMAGEQPKDIVALSTLADMLRGHSRFSEAAEVYTEALDRVEQPGARHWSLLYARGISLERSGRWRDAEADLKQALELRPNQPFIMNYLGYSWADQGVNLDAAVEMIRTAVSLRPTDGYMVDSLGWVLYRMGRYEEAAKHLERAVELRPEDPTINDHLGDVYWHVGRRRESCFQWRRVLVLDPEEGQVPAVEKKLEEGLGDTGAFRGCV